jgi:hypothetical protein
MNIYGNVQIILFSKEGFFLIREILKSKDA